MDPALAVHVAAGARALLVIAPAAGLTLMSAGSATLGAGARARDGAPAHPTIPGLS